MNATNITKRERAVIQEAMRLYRRMMRETTHWRPRIGLFKACAALAKARQ